MPISLTEFEIVEIPECGFKDLKVVDIEDFQKMTFQEGEIGSGYKVGDRVSCNLKTLYDGVNLVIIKLKSIPK